jgi:RHS repeat-associated protein
VRLILTGTVSLVVGAGSAHAQTLTETRTSSFTYRAADGLLESETVEPDSPDLCVKTVYGYDAVGNRKTSTVQSCAGVQAQYGFVTRSASTDYEQYSITVLGAAVTVPANTYATRATNALSQSETRRYDPRFGSVVSQTGPNGLTTTWTLDDFGRKVRETAADGTYVEVFYCAIANPSSADSDGCASLPTLTAPGDAAVYMHSQPRAANGAVNGPYARVYYDRAGREIRAVTQGFAASGEAPVVYKDTRYGRYGGKQWQSEPYFRDLGSSLYVGSGGTTYGRNHTVYDALGRPVATYVADQKGTDVVPDGSGLPATKSIVTYGGNTITTTVYVAVSGGGTQARTRNEEKNAIGEIVRVTDALGAQVAHQRDAFGNLIKTRDALGNQIVNGYDRRGRRKSMNDPNSGLWTYDYNALGELISQQSPNQRAAGTATTMTYDVLGRVKTKAQAEFTSTWTYDSCTKGIGKPCTVNSNHGVNKSFSYDGYGRPSSSTVAIGGGPTFTGSVTYEANTGRIASRTYPTGAQVALEYNALGFVARSYNAQTTQTYFTALNVNAWGQLEGYRHGNNVQSAVSHDPYRSRTLSIVTTPPSGNGARCRTNPITLELECDGGSLGSVPPPSRTYTWDNIGNLLTRAEDPDGSGPAEVVTEEFFYDAINRLQRYKVSNSAITDLAREVELKYNALGSILYKTDVGGYTYPATGAARPHAVSAVTGVNGAASRSYGYDANGNLITASAGEYRSIAYTSFNLPDSQSGVQGAGGSPKYVWQYDENYARIKETRSNSAGTRTTWSLHPDKANGLAFEQEVAPDGTVSNRHYVSAWGMTVAMFTSTGTAPTAVSDTEYWHTDHLGSIVALTRADGTVKARYSYDPFGKRRQTTGVYDRDGTIDADYPTGTDRGFTGHEHLDDVGIVHMNGRLYDAHIGRFLQSDPVVGDSLDLQTFNRYSYVMNNPLNMTDPSGECPVCIIAIGVAYAASTAITNPRLRMVVAIAAAIAIGPEALAIGVAEGGVVLSVGVAGFSSGLIASGGDFKAGLKGAATALVFYGIGQAATAISDANVTEALRHFADGNIAAAESAQQWAMVFNNQGVGRALMHAVGGCATAAMSGDNCGRGAMTAGVGKLISANGPGAGSSNIIVGTIRSSAIGGTLSVIGGGKFANGAMTGAFQYLFNECATTRMCGSLGTRILVRANVAAESAGYLTEPTSLHTGIEIIDGYSGIRTIDGTRDKEGYLSVKLNSTDWRIPRLWYEFTLPSDQSISERAEWMWRAANSFNSGLRPQYSFPNGIGDMGNGFNSNSITAGLLGSQAAYEISRAAARSSYIVPGLGRPVSFH